MRVKPNHGEWNQSPAEIYFLGWIEFMHGGFTVNEYNSFDSFCSLLLFLNVKAFNELQDTF